MARMWSTLLCAFVAASLVTIAAGACSLTTAYSSGYSGDGTYYGPYTNGGACSLDGPTPPTSVGLDTVAIGGGVWAGSQACGMCLNLTGNGKGSGAKPIVGSRIVFVNNKCPECGTGLDLGTSGDGRWEISWKAVPCPVDSASKKNFQYKFQGSHQWYIKLQVRNTRYPVAYVSLIQSGVEKKLARQDDNFWLSGGDVSYPLSGDLTVKITSVTGDTVTDTIVGGVSADNTKVIDGSAQFPVCGSSSTATATTSTTKSATTSATTATTATSTTKSATTSATTATTATSTTKSATTTATTATSTTTSATTSATTSTTKSATSTTTGSTTGSSGSVDVYTDDVVSPFQSWSWGTFTVVSGDFAQSGSKSFKLTPSNWNAAYFRGAVSTSVYKSIEFYVYSATTIKSDSLQFALLKGDAPSTSVKLTSYLGNATSIVGSQWTKGTIALNAFTNGPYDGFWFQDAVNSQSPTPVYFDSIKLFKN